ncbi:MAG: ClpXP protease specificity-enhancing factor [Gammaproteobacteria bacterium]|nr:ClpXP protease specificity-enhancing factor [Gammaproteobacteria bacterium]
MAEPSFTSLKPYLLRAHHQWMADNGLTPHLVVDADIPGVVVPREHVKNGTIVLKIAAQSIDALVMGNEHVEFLARFRGISKHIFLPIDSIRALIDMDYGVGMSFAPEDDGAAAEGAGEGPDNEPPPDAPRPRPRPSLRVVK